MRPVPCVIIWSQLSLAPWNIVSAACAAPLDWSQDVIFSALSLLFSFFFASAKQQAGLVSRDGGLCAGYVAAAARPRSPLHISQLSWKIIRLSPSRWTFFTHIQLDAVKERKSRLTLIATLCVRVQSAVFFCAVSTLFASRSAFIKGGMCGANRVNTNFLTGRDMVFVTSG